jgi:hypothetical protein
MIFDSATTLKKFLVGVYEYRPSGVLVNFTICPFF